MKNAKEVEMALYKTVQIIQMSTKQEQRCRERERDSGLVRDWVMRYSGENDNVVSYGTKNNR